MRHPRPLKTLVLSLIAALVLAACGGGAASVLEGQIDLRGDVSLPADGHIEITVYQENEIIGRVRVVSDGEPPPYDFRLVIVPDRQPSPWTLEALAHDGDGNLIGATPQPVSVPNERGTHDIEVVVTSPS